MPTGYTADVGKKNISFRKYALNCARAFGACIEMRDDSPEAKIPNEFKPSTYHLEQLEESRWMLKGANNLSNIQASIDAERLYDKYLQDYADRLNSIATTATRYVKMRAKSKNWKAPTSEHTELRDFMISQLEQSIDFDCSAKYIEVPKRMKPTEYRDMLIKEARESIKYHEQGYQEDVKIAKKRSEWVKQLRKSLP